MPRSRAFLPLVRRFAPVACAVLCWTASPAAGPVWMAGPASALSSASGDIEALVGRVSQSVVQIAVRGYRPGAEGTLGASHGVGSGVVIDDEGYILTNAHVVAGAERIEVTLPERGESVGPPRLGSTDRPAVEARLVAVAPELDLALIAVDVTGLPPLGLADYSTLRQGELVFAFGSPDGLRNSVSMGMVSAVARQMEDQTPLVYVQTDAAINPGMSGGPLVNVRGELVGINTFIRTASGGSEGLGFALPSAFVAQALPQLREFGHLHRAAVGVAVQTVTPLMGTGLNLPLDARLIVADVAPSSPAEAAGLQPGDVITAIDGTPVSMLTSSDLYLQLAGLTHGDALTLSSTRRGEARVATMLAVEVPHVCERARVIDTAGTLVEPLGILGLPVTGGAPGDGTRSASGVLVAVRVSATRTPGGALERGDVIRAVNGTAVPTPDALRAAMEAIRRHDAVVLQVERQGRLTFVAFERE